MTPDERIETLERALMRMKNYAIGLLAGVIVALGGVILAICIGLGATKPPRADNATPKEIRANKFTVVDDEGRELARLSAADSEPSLLFFDKNNTVRVILAEHALMFGPALLLYDANGKPRAGLNVAKDGPRLWMGDEDGKDRIWMDSTAIGPRMVMYDDSNNARLSLNTARGVPELVLYDKKNTVRAEFSMDKNGPAVRLRDENCTTRAALIEQMLTLFDDKGRGRASLASAETGAALTLSDEKEKDRVLLGALEDSQMIFLFDKNKKLLWHAP